MYDRLSRQLNMVTSASPYYRKYPPRRTQPRDSEHSARWGLWSLAVEVAVEVGAKVAVEVAALPRCVT